MSNLQLFQSPQFGEIRTLTEDGRPLFCGSDVAKALGYALPRKAILDHCKGVLKRNIPTNGGEQEMSFIHEGDLYRLITHSKLPDAEKFEGWVFDEILPSIRKHGAYMTPETLEAAILNPDTMIKLCTALKDEQDKRKALEAVNSDLAVQVQIAKPKADYFDELVDRGVNLSIRESAKQLGIKERAFVDFLIGHKYLYRDKKGKLSAYAQHANDLFVTKECFNDKTNWGGTQTLVTPKGRETFRLLMQGM